MLGAAAACLAASSLGVPGDVARDRLERAKPRPLRMEPRPLGGATALLDCYNASPESSLLAIDFLRSIQVPGRRWLAFGEMRELGEHSIAAHRDVGERAAGLDGAFFYGSGCEPASAAFRLSAPGRPGGLFTDIDELAGEVHRRVSPGDAILIKGSRLAAMERVYETCLRMQEGS